MIGRGIRRSLAWAAFCFGCLAIGGVSYSQDPGLIPICEDLEDVLSEFDVLLQNCEEYGDCDVIQSDRDNVSCDVDECWGTALGYCPAG